MRASERIDRRVDQTGQWWFSFSDWFWDHPNGFCERHCTHDRRKRIGTFLRTEHAPPAPEAARAEDLTSAL